MSHSHSANPKLLVYALFLSPALIALHSCGEKDKESSNSSGTPTHLTKTESAPPSMVVREAPLRPVLPEDPQAAFDALTAANALDVRTRLIANPKEWAARMSLFYRAWGRLDPEAALRAAPAEGKTAFAATMAVVEGWTDQDPRSARDWVAQQESEALLNHYARALVKAWPGEDLADLATWVQDHPALLPQVALKWSDSSPPEAARWLGSLPAGPEQRQATESLFRKWGADDPGAAGDYLIATGTLANRDAAVAAYATTVVRDNADAAEQWAREITDPTLQEAILAALPKIQPLQVTTPLP